MWSPVPWLLFPLPAITSLEGRKGRQVGRKVLAPAPTGLGEPIVCISSQTWKLSNL